MKDINPRVLCFLAAHGLTLAELERVDGETRRVTIDGCNMPWPGHFMLWNSAQWRAWAAELGFTRGMTPHQDALLAGHAEGDHDEWLHRRCGLSYCPPGPR